MSVATNLFELRRQLNQLLLLYYKICPGYPTFKSTGRSPQNIREFTKPGRQRQPERHLKFQKASLVSVRYL